MSLRLYPYQVGVLLLIDLGFWIGYTNAEDTVMSWDAVLATLIWSLILLVCYLAVTAIHSRKDSRKGGDI